MMSFWSTTKVRAARQVSEGLAGVGARLPLGARLAVARRAHVLRHLLKRTDEFVHERYLSRYRIRVDPRSAIEFEMFRGAYERDVLRIVRSFVRPGEVCVDVGANVGAIALALCDQVGSAGHVHCFEPGPPFFARLEANFALNPDLRSRVSLHAVGLSDRPGELLWSQDPLHPWNGGFIPHEEKVALPVVRLDEFVDRSGTRRVDFIKVDVEGMELDVLRGAVGTLEKHRPRLLVETIMEFEQPGPVQIRRELEQFLRGLGYGLYEVTRGARLRAVSYPRLPSNTLALPREEALS